jgi:glutamate dehydrogenase
MQIESQSGKIVSDGRPHGAIFEDAFMASGTAKATTIPITALVLAAGLGCRQVTVLRAYGRYLRQAGIPTARATSPTR